MSMRKVNLRVSIKNTTRKFSTQNKRIYPVIKVTITWINFTFDCVYRLISYILLHQSKQEKWKIFQQLKLSI